MPRQTPEQSATIRRIMGEYRRGVLRSSSGRLVTSREQAIAIALSEAGLGYDSVPDPRKEAVAMARRKRAKKAGKKRARKGRRKAAKKTRKTTARKTRKKRTKKGKKGKFSKTAYNQAIRAGAGTPQALQVGWGRWTVSEAVAKSRGPTKRPVAVVARKRAAPKRRKKAAKKRKKVGKRIARRVAEEYTKAELVKEVKRARAEAAAARRAAPARPARKRRKKAAKKVAARAAPTPRRGRARMVAPVSRFKATVQPRLAVTAQSILRARTAGQLKHWICSGYKRTGCGGGTRGGHVTGYLR